MLDDVSFSVTSGQKVGVCGRTGSGKSSLMLTLFRVLELDGGSISIDGLDIASLGLSQLRKAIAMLPQDPTLFSGSIRENLDPFQEHNDAKLWDALEKAQLKDAIEDMPDKLSTEVTSQPMLCRLLVVNGSILTSAKAMPPLLVIRNNDAVACDLCRCLYFTGAF